MKTLVLTTANGGHTAFSLSDQELEDLRFALTFAVVDAESYLNNYGKYLTVHDQFQHKRRLDRLNSLLEQFNRSEGYELF